MKRFYCTICKAVKRVRKHPKQVLAGNQSPTSRIGQCNKHSIGYQGSISGNTFTQKVAGGK